MIEKLILGTAGLGGLPYGREKRALTEQEAKAVMRTALDAGIYAFDTSPAYGHAERWLAEALDDFDPKHENEYFVYSKNRGCADQAIQSLEHLYWHADVQFVYHNWDGAIDIASMPWIKGASVYFEDLTGKWLPTTVQIPWNILHQTDLSWKSQSTCKEVIARSVFLQGALAGAPAPNGMIQAHIERAARLAKVHHISIEELALSAAVQNEQIDGVIIGAMRPEEVKKCLSIVRADHYIDFEELSMLNVKDIELIDPRKWAA